MCRLYMDRQSLNLELIGVMLPAAMAVPGATEQLPSTLQAQARSAVKLIHIFPPRSQPGW